MSYEAALCVQRLKEIAREQGFLTYSEVNAQLPLSMVDPEEISAIIQQLESSGVRVIEGTSEARQ